MMPKVIKINRPELDDLYNHFKKPIPVIAQELNVEPWQLKKKMVEFGIEIDEEREKLYEEEHSKTSSKLYAKKKIKEPKNIMQVKQKLKDSNVKYSRRNQNAVLPHSNKESWLHWLCKCILFKALRDDGHEIFTEMPFGDAIIDILDVTSSTSYELESKPSKKTAAEKLKTLNNSAIDLQVLDLSKIPKSVILDFLKEIKKHCPEVLPLKRKK